MLNNLWSYSKCASVIGEMRIEMPNCARCCVCVPLRHGILIFGYLNLLFTIFLLALEIWLSVLYDSDYSVSEVLSSSTIYMYRGVGLFSQMWFIYILYGLEIAFNIVLLVGAHTKRTNLMRAYYYYGITTSLAAFVCYVLIRSESDSWKTFYHHYAEFCVAFSGLVLQVYLLLLIRAELKKLDQKNQLCFVNHASEVYVDPPFSDGRNPL